MRRRKIKPARRPHLALLPLQRHEKIGADGEKLPRDEKMQAISREEHQPKAQHQYAPPNTA